MFLIESIIFEETVNFLIETEPSKEIRKKAIEKIMLNSRVLTFSNDNDKVGKDITTFSLPAGWTCPFALDCKMKVDRYTKEREYGDKNKFECYAAWMEIQYHYVRENRWHNYDLLKEANGVNEKAELILRSIKFHEKEHGKIDSLRIHESGDFYNGEYLLAWLEVARQRPDIEFYAYTKSLPYIQQYKEEIDAVSNFKLNISAGSSRPDLENELDLPIAGVYNTPEEVLATGRLIDLDDRIAKDKENKEDFAMLVHGMQTFATDTPDITKNRKRNEVFMKYHKHKHLLNEQLGLDKDHVMSNDEAKAFNDDIQELVDDKKITLSKGDVIQLLLRNIIKYNNYNFDKNLINIVPPKFR
jgi:hypothetical protein